MQEFTSARQLTQEDLGRWRWIMREAELQNLQMHRLQESQHLLHELINTKYGLVDGDQFTPDGQIVRKSKAPTPNVVPIAKEAQELQSQADAAKEAKG